MQLNFVVISLLSIQAVASTSWWTYDGVSGPSFWGLLDPEWEMCHKGKRQSPINVETNNVLFDPRLGNLQVTVGEVSGVLQNTGQYLVFRVTNEDQGVSVTGGPLSYKYQFEKMIFHYGPNDTVGSEHQINGKHFPGEIQLYSYNKDLYRSMSEAQQKPQGVAVISVMVRVGESPPELRLLTSSLTKVVYKDRSHPIENLNISSILPSTREYVTYEGSYTEPGCWESVVWIMYNKPIFMSVQEMYGIRKLMQGAEQSPKSSLSINVRPVQFSQLTVRTNITPSGRAADDCHNLYTESGASGYGPHEDLSLISSI